MQFCHVCYPAFLHSNKVKMQTGHTGNVNWKRSFPVREAFFARKTNFGHNFQGDSRVKCLDCEHPFLAYNQQSNIFI